MGLPFGIEFVLDLQHEFVIIRPVFRPGQIQRLMGAQQGRVVAVLDVHLGGVQVELIHRVGVIILIPVDQEFGVALVSQLEALEPARIAVVRHQRRGVFLL